MPTQGARRVTEAHPWVLATRSAGKLRELRPIFRQASISVIDLTEAGVAESPEEDAIECHDTFESNALAKARYFFALTGCNVVADDSGLEVRALDGAPGVRSKRWSGKANVPLAELEAANNELLVRRLRGVQDRRARFVCAAAWCGPDGAMALRGEVPGEIVDVPAGSQGFGYDPYFFSDELGMTLASATIAQKQRVSHRGRAFAALIAALRERGVIDVTRK